MFRQKIKLWIIWLFFVLATIIGINFLLYRVVIHSFYSKLPDRYPDDDYPLLRREQVVQLGWAHADTSKAFFSNKAPLSSYQFKPSIPGKINVGCFGDSFTMGDELAAGFDFPSLLQKYLDSLAPDTYQVINFGTSGYSLGQCFMLYQYFRNQYPLDIIILHLFEHMRLRDNTFKYHEHVPLHGRYILAGNESEIKYIPVAGDSRLAAIKRYYRFFPAPEVRKYDIKTPAFLKVVCGNIDEYGYTDHYNPFYYYRNRLLNESEKEKELELLYRLLVKNFSTMADRLFILSNDSIIQSIFTDHIPANTTIIDIPMNQLAHANRSFYRMPHYHFSPTGNGQIALQTASALTDKPFKPGGFVLRPTFDKDTAALFTYNLSAFDSICLQIHGNNIARLYYNDNPAHSAGFYQKAALKEDQTKSLILVNGKNWKDQIFFPTLFPLNGVEKTFMTIKFKGKSAQKFFVGSLKFFKPMLYRFEGRPELKGSSATLLWMPEEESILPAWKIISKQKVAAASLSIGQHEVDLSIIATWREKEESDFTHILAFPRYAAFRSTNNAFLADARKDIQQVVDLTYFGADTIIRVPAYILQWKE